MASWELGQGQIPSLGERVEHRGLLYHDCPPYHHHGGGCGDDDDCNDDDCVDIGTMNNNNAIYEAGDKDKWDQNNGHVKGMVAHLVSEDNGWISSQLQSIICIGYTLRNTDTHTQI